MPLTVKNEILIHQWLLYAEGQLGQFQNDVNFVTSLLICHFFSSFLNVFTEKEKISTLYF